MTILEPVQKHSKQQSQNCVVLLHGLAEMPLTMTALGIALQCAGYEVANIGYPSTTQTIPNLLSDHIEPLFGRYSDKKLHFVTHSLGGVLLHAALSHGVPANLGRVVMIAPGLKGSDALEVYRYNWFFRMLYGPAAFQSGTGADAFAHIVEQEARYPLGIVAGCVSLDPVANFIVPWSHDGKISVERTHIRGMADHIVLMAPHDLSASDPAAIVQTLHFLSKGCFLHLPPARQNHPSAA